MIDGNVAIQIIESRLTNLIRQGQLNAKYNKSSKSISFYLRDIEVNSQPILTLRLSNHRSDFQGYIKKTILYYQAIQTILVLNFSNQEEAVQVEGKKMK